MIRNTIILILFSTAVFGNQEYIDLSHRVSDQFVKDYSRRASIQLCGFGGGMMDDIDVISLRFVGYHRLDLAAARRLYVDGMKDLLNRYNTNKTVRPYLHNFPFKMSNLDIMLLLEDRAKGYVPMDYVATVFGVGDNIYYSHFDSHLDRLVNFHEEPYEEALRIIQAENEQTASGLTHTREINN